MSDESDHTDAGGSQDGARDHGAGDLDGSQDGSAGDQAEIPGGGTGESADPAGLLSEVRAVRRQARLARHAYWFPLVVFGLLTCASVPFYIRRFPVASGARSRGSSPLRFLRSDYLGAFSTPLVSSKTSYYWLAALLAGVAATAFWYRWRGRRVGLRTPARGYLITGVALLVLALLIPVLAEYTRLPLVQLMPGDLLIRGTFPFVIIAVGLCFLAWAERSIVLTLIAAGYLALSLVASLYDIENVFYTWFGWTLGPSVSGLPNVVLPALVLLLSGAGAWVTQRRRRAPPAEPAAAG